MLYLINEYNMKAINHFQWINAKNDVSYLLSGCIFNLFNLISFSEHSPIMATTLQLFALSITLVHYVSSQTTYDARSSLNEFACTDATPADTCNLYCDSANNSNLIFDCGNAGTCNFHCTQYKCATSSNLSSSNTNNLYISTIYDHCFTESNIHLPNNGNATIISTNTQALKHSEIHSGINTDNIIIECQSNYSQSCRQIKGKQKYVYVDYVSSYKQYINIQNSYLI